MKTVLLLLAVLVFEDCPRSSHAEGLGRLAEVRSFAFAAGVENVHEEIGKLSRYDLVVVDGENVSSADVKAIQTSGTIVLAYLSVGTIEKGRSWYRLARKYRLDLWEDWGEWYADTSRQGFRDVITRRVAPLMLRRGFDGLFLDNVDMIETHRAQGAGMGLMVRSLSRLVHRRGKFLFTQNGTRSIRRIIRLIDGWNLEDVTSTYNFETEAYEKLDPESLKNQLELLRRVGEKHILTTASDYVAEGDPATTEESIRNACSAGAIPFVSDINLSRIPEQPLRCGVARQL